MFQSGEVDYLVATDAIGMGLNMDLDHVAFARIVKFDGRGPRRLDRRRDRPDRRPRRAAYERRHLRHHRRARAARSRNRRGGRDSSLRPAERLYWRNARLRFRSSTRSWQASRRGPSTAAASSRRARPTTIARCGRWRATPRSRSTPHHRGAVRLLWEVCQIPDFRKVMSETHTRLLAQIYRHLAGPDERLPTEWVAGQMGVSTAPTATSTA